MGTKRRVAIWYKRGHGEYCVIPPGWKPRDGDIVFSKKTQLIDFARASGLILREKVGRYA